MTTKVFGSDPRFGMQAPITETSERMPSGLLKTTRERRGVEGEDPTNIFDIFAQVDSTTVNGLSTTIRTDRSEATATRTSAAGRRTQIEMDGLGRATSVVFPGRAALTQEFDEAGRLALSAIGTRITALDYDASDRITRVTDPMGVIQQATYDVAGRTKSVTWPGLEVRFGYDAAGHVSSVTPSGRAATQLHLNAAGELETYTPPALSSGPTSPLRITYDGAGRPARITNPDGTMIESHSDATSPDVIVTTSTGDTSLFRHSVTTLKLTSAQFNRGSSVSYTYDGKLATGVTWSGPIQGSVNYGYDPQFRLAQERINGGNSVLFTYDADGLLVQAGAFSLIRSPIDGAVMSTAIGDATTSTSYSEYGEVDSTTMTVGGTRVYSAQYVVDGSGRIVNKLETSTGSSTNYVYTYDSLSRLTDVAQNGTAVEHLEYDAAGNVVRRTTPAGTVVATVDEQDRLLTYGSFRFDHNANGEMVAKIAGTDTMILGYSAFGQLRSARLPNGTSIDYILDADGRRVGKRIDGAVARGWLYRDKWRAVAEISSTGALVSQFVYGPQSIAPEYMVRDGTTYRFIVDERGSVLAVVNASTGTVAQRLTYDALGHVTSNSNPDFQPFGYAGGLYDHQTGLTHFGAREYDASVGRWTSRDPSLFQGGDFNLYRYANGDPINLTDPRGRTTLPETTEAMDLDEELTVAEEQGVQEEIQNVKQKMCSLSARLVNVYGRMKNLAPNWQNHHILQDAAMRGVGNYSRYRGISLPLYGGSHIEGSPHDLANKMQHKMLGEAEDDVAIAALRAAGCKQEDIDTIMKAVDQWVQDEMTIPLP